MKKYFFIIACLFTTLVVAENKTLYFPETETVEIFGLSIVDQEGDYYIEMQRTEEDGFNFEVTFVEKNDSDGIEDPSKGATFDPATGIVVFPSVSIYSSKEGVPFETYSVKMLKKEEDSFIFTVTETIPLFQLN